MLSKYLYFLTCLHGAFAFHTVGERRHYTVNDEQYQNVVMNVNSTVDPCDDFYAYACGSYAENHPDINYQEITSFVDYQYNHQLLNLMDTLYQLDYQVTDQCQSFVEKTRIYLKSCRTTTERDIKKYFDEIKPARELNWPIWQPRQWRKEGKATRIFDIWSLVGRIQSYGLNNVLINQEIVAEEDGTFSIMLEPPVPEEGTTLPETMIMIVLLKRLGIDKTEKIIANLTQLDEKLLSILRLVDDENEDSIALRYGQLDSAYPQLNLKQYFRELFPKELPANTLILIRKPNYLQQLNDNMWQIFERRTMCNYLMLKFLEYLAKDSVPEFTALACIKELRNKMDVSVNYLYKEHILCKDIGEINKDIKELQQYLLIEYDKIFNENHLQLNAQQLQLLRRKLHDVTLNVGNLPLNSTYMVIENYYENVPPLDRNNYFKNHLLLLKHRFEKSLLYIPHQTHYIVADNSVGSDSGALYVPKQNMIMLPFGSLQRPFYHLNYLPVYKISLLAFILAHEYTHAFDSTGLNFNGHGEQSDQVATILEERSFQNSLECLQSQLTTDSIDERIADIVGSRVVYNLFKNHPKTKEFFCSPYDTPYNCDSTLASLRNFYPKQFYLNMAQFFCGKSQLEFVDHDSDSARINQVAINSEGFAKAFHCPLGSKMNPEHKCRIY